MQRIRGQETTVQFVVNGVLMEDSWAKVENFTLTPRADLVETDFLGETESDLDVQHHGYDFSFSIHHAEPSALDFMREVATRDRNHQLPSTINVVVTHNYRDPALSSEILVLQSCVMKLDSHGFGGRKEYVKDAFSGKCKSVAGLG
jgi:hypothetical protein